MVEYKLLEEKELYNIEDFNNILESLLYYQSKMSLNDIDLSTNDYVKIKNGSGFINALNYEPNYIKKIAPLFIKSENGTKEFEEEKILMLKEIEKLKKIQFSSLSMKITKKFMDSFVFHVLSEKQIKILMEKYSLDFSFSKEYSNFRLNLSFSDLEDGIGLFCSIRKLNKTSFSIEEMNISENILKKFLIPEGLILISGPTGHAKTSTLISLLSWINENEEKKIITIEEPIEFYWSNLQKKSTFRQREIGKTCNSFYDGLKSAVRQNPNIIVIGEMRDKETVETAIEAALTGHLVIATIHVNSTTEVLNRILGFFDGPKLKEVSMKLAGALKFVLNQRLITTLNDKKRIAYEWLNTEKDGIKALVQKNILDEVRLKMSELDENGKSPHKTLNESLFELIVLGEITEKEAKEKYSNELNRFDSEFEIYKKRYCELTGIRLEQLNEIIFTANEIEKKKKNKI